MSNQNVEIVRDIIEAHERRDFAAVFAHYDPLIEWDIGALIEHGAMDTQPVYHGHEGVREFWRAWFAAMESTYEYEELIDAGEVVIAILSQRMRGRSSGIELEWRSYAQVWTLADHRVTRVAFFMTREEALAATADSLSRRNLDAVRRAYAAFNAGDPSVWLGLYDPDIVLRVPPKAGPEPGLYVGAGAVERYFTDFFRPFGRSFQAEVLESFAIGDSVVTVQRNVATGRSSHVEVEAQAVANVITFRGGRVIRFEMAENRDAAVRLVQPNAPAHSLAVSDGT